MGSNTCTQELGSNDGPYRTKHCLGLLGSGKNFFFRYFLPPLRQAAVTGSTPMQTLTHAHTAANRARSSRGGWPRCDAVLMMPTTSDAR